MVMKRPPVMISLSGRVEQLHNPPDLGLTMAAAAERFVEF